MSRCLVCNTTANLTVVGEGPGSEIVCRPCLDELVLLTRKALGEYMGGKS